MADPVIETTTAQALVFPEAPQLAALVEITTRTGAIVEVMSVPVVEHVEVFVPGIPGADGEPGPEGPPGPPGQANLPPDFVFDGGNF